MAKLGRLFSYAGERNGRLVWIGLAHSWKHPLSAAVPVRIQLWARTKQRGLFLLFLDLGPRGPQRDAACGPEGRASASVPSLKDMPLTQVPMATCISITFPVAL